MTKTNQSPLYPALAALTSEKKALAQIADEWADRVLSPSDGGVDVEALEAVREVLALYPASRFGTLVDAKVRVGTAADLASVQGWWGSHKAEGKFWPQGATPYLKGQVRGIAMWPLNRKLGGYLQFLESHRIEPNFLNVAIADFIVNELGYTIPGAEALFVAARKTGGWAASPQGGEIIVLPRPRAIHLVEGRIHSEEGPAILYPDGSGYFYLRGIEVPPKVILNPDAITVHEVQTERNAELRRILLDRMGRERYLRESGAKVLHKDEWGTLYRAEVPGDEPLVMVEVVNSTPEPDGSYKDYMIRVDPRCRTAREAVAWTFGKEPGSYAPSQET